MASLHPGGYCTQRHFSSTQSGRQRIAAEHAFGIAVRRDHEAAGLLELLQLSYQLTALPVAVEVLETVLTVLRPVRHRHHARQAGLHASECIKFTLGDYHSFVRCGVVREAGQVPQHQLFAGGSPRHVPLAAPDLGVVQLPIQRVVVKPYRPWQAVNAEPPAQGRV